MALVIYLMHNTRPPQGLKLWLTYQESLTEKLQTYTHDTRLEVIQQVWKKTTWWDHYRLNLDKQSINLHRDIITWAGNAPCWYARTILPSVTYKTNASLFDRLNKESLGELIFGNQFIERVNFSNYCISNESLEYYWLPKNLRETTDLFWVRLSEFQFNNNPLRPSFYLCEILLSDLASYPCV